MFNYLGFLFPIWLLFSGSILNIFRKVSLCSLKSLNFFVLDEIMNPILVGVFFLMTLKTDALVFLHHCQ